jgi:OmpA-OmpF porin, OOP family
MKIDVNNGWAMNLDFSKRLPFYDYIDGVKAAAGTTRSDGFGFVSMGLIYRFRAKNDKDRDGVTDAEDSCPLIFGNPMLAGCPDQDGDAVPDKDDLCPTEVGDRNLSGCPKAKASYEVRMIKEDLR